MYFRKLVLLVLTTFVIIGCSKNTSNKENTDNESYSFKFLYPTLPLLAGDGVVLRDATGVECVNSKGEAVDNSFCPGIDSVSLNDAPKEPQFSPAGDKIVTIPNTSNVVYIPLDEGQTLSDLSETQKYERLRDKVVCNSGLLYSVKNECAPQSYRVESLSETVNNLAPCQGEVVTERDYNCIDEITEQVALASECSSLSKDYITLLSPEGTSEHNLSNGDIVVLSCGLGKSSSDIGQGTEIASYTSCGTDRHKEDLLCVNDTYTASNFTYPSNNLLTGDGVVSVEATGFQTCLRDHDSEVAPLEKCSLPTPTPTITYSSPSGLKRLTNSKGDDLTASLNEGEVFSDSSVVSQYHSCGPGRFLDSSSICIDEKIVKVQEVTMATAFLTNSKKVYAIGNASMGGSIPEDKKLLLENVKEITSHPSGRVFVALREDGTAISWGDSSRGGSSPPVTNVKNIQHTSKAVIALKNDGSVVAWGLTPDSTVPVGAQTNVRKIVTNFSAVVAITNSNSLVAWGNSVDGGTIPAPILSATNGKVLDVYASNTAFLVRTSEGKVYKWGTIEPNGCVISDGTVLSNIQSSLNFFAGIKQDGRICVHGGQYGMSSEAVQNSIGVDSFVLTNDSVMVLSPDQRALYLSWDTNEYVGIEREISNVQKVVGANTVLMGLKTNGSVELVDNFITDYRVLNDNEESSVSLINDVIDIKSGPSHFELIKQNGEKSYVVVGLFGNKPTRYNGVREVISARSVVLVKMEQGKDVLYSGWILSGLPVHLFESPIQ